MEQGKFENILTVGMKKGEMDFGVRATISELSFEEMKEFRAMIVVAIGQAEDMWRRYRKEGGKSDTTKNDENSLPLG